MADEGKGQGQIYVNSAHPGLVGTSFFYNVFKAHGYSEETSTRANDFAGRLLTHIGVAFTADEGALTQLFLATSLAGQDGGGIRGQYFVPVAGRADTDPHVSNRCCLLVHAQN